MAEKYLSSQKQKQLIEQFERLEKIVAGRHEAFHKTIEYFAKSYLQ